MAKRGEVLVAILNNLLDLNVVQERLWYRIPVSAVERFLKDRWPPQWLAFYQTKVFGPEAFSINYFGRVVRIAEVCRSQLFPGQPQDAKSQQRYYQVFIDRLRRLPHPIVGRRLRRIVFIPTTWRKFVTAAEVNDLYDDSPLEDLLWDELKRLQIPAERQEFVQMGGKFYCLDFAIRCAEGALDVETDGDTYHANPEKAPQDMVRDNSLTAAGWRVLHFSTAHVKEQMADYCVPEIVTTVNTLGGIDLGGELPRKLHPNPEMTRQLGLFDDM